MTFLTIREQRATVQTKIFVDDNTSQGMCTYSSKIPKESIVDITAKVEVADEEITSCT